MSDRQGISEGGFLSTIPAAATRFLPAILAGLVAGTADQDVEGNGMFLGTILTRYNMLEKDC